MKVLVAFFLVLMLSCHSEKAYQELTLTDEIDPDIILINIGNSNRIEIADLLLAIDSCDPLTIGIDVIFPRNNDVIEDSILAAAIKRVKNDILAYRIDSVGRMVKSIDKIKEFSRDEGYVDFDRRRGVSSHFTPSKRVDGKMYESFALKILKQWKPELKTNFVEDKSIPILFQRSLQQYYYFVKEDLLDKNICELLKSKIVLVGYLGPGDEDKHYTPFISRDKGMDDKPDTYGLVIQANAIRTLLEYRSNSQ